MLPTLEQIQSARSTIAGTAIRTPLVRFNEDGPAEIYLKLENLQPIGAFKIRGAANAIARIPREELSKGVITASAGNMAQGVAWCARDLGIPCTVISPDTAPAAKISAVERLGGKVIKAPFEDWWRAFEQRAYPGVEGRFIHAFDDLDVMAGNGTIGLEIIEDLPDVDAVVVPFGGGGLACGIAAAIKAVKPACRCYAAEVDTAAPLVRAMEAGKPQTVPYQTSFVDGIGSKTVFPQMLERALQLLEASLVTTLDEIASAIRILVQRNRIVAEGAGACGVAAARAGRAGTGKVVCIVSGGNIDAAKLAAILTA
ncbi:MAG TPA: threonine/serine dehydratase [Bryobacteraceae bacterium]|nr:threonine/serine dehydratase [Bryobacteraceae bacterium]